VVLQMNKWLELSISLLVIFLISFAPLSYAAEGGLPVPVGRVVWVKGTLKAEMPNKEVRTLQRASIIYLSDILTTDDKSQAQIVFTDNSLMTFRPTTTFVIKEYHFNPNAKGKSAGKYIMNLIEGGFRTITGLIAKKNPNDYQINTPVATIGVRGTDFSIYFQDGNLYMARYEGSPCMSGGSGSLCLTSTTPSYAYTSPTQPPTPVTAKPAVFEVKEEIVPTKMEPFATETGGTATGTPAGGGTTTTGGEDQVIEGKVSSFCITN